MFSLVPLNEHLAMLSMPCLRMLDVCVNCTETAGEAAEVEITDAILVGCEVAEVGPVAASCARSELAEVYFRRGHLFQLAGVLRRSDRCIRCALDWRHSERGELHRREMRWRRIRFG